MLGLKLNHVSKRGHMYQPHHRRVYGMDSDYIHVKKWDVIIRPNVHRYLVKPPLKLGHG